MVTPIARLKQDSSGNIPIGFPAYRNVILDYGQQHNLHVIDLGQLSITTLNNCKQSEQTSMYMPDQVHLTDIGARIYAKIVADAFYDLCIK